PWPQRYSNFPPHWTLTTHSKKTCILECVYVKVRSLVLNSLRNECKILQHTRSIKSTIQLGTTGQTINSSQPSTRYAGCRPAEIKRWAAINKGKYVVGAPQ